MGLSQSCCLSMGYILNRLPCLVSVREKEPSPVELMCQDGEIPRGKDEGEKGRFVGEGDWGNSELDT